MHNAAVLAVNCPPEFSRYYCGSLFFVFCLQVIFNKRVGALACKAGMAGVVTADWTGCRFAWVAAS